MMGKDRIRNCPLCSSDAYSIWYAVNHDYIRKYWNIDENYLKSQEFSPRSQIEIVRCRKCGMYYNRTHSDWALRDATRKVDIPVEEQKEPDFHIDGSSQKMRTVSMALNIAMRKKGVKYFKKADLKILDFSCGGGGTLKIISAFGVKNVYGYDIVDRDVRYFNIPSLLFFNDMKKLQAAGPFDLIFNEGSLEHYNFPLEILKEMKKLLKPEGILFLGCPVLPYRYFGNYKRGNLLVGKAKGYFHSGHINHFSIPHLAKAIRRAGFKILPITSASLEETDDIDWKNKKSLLSAFKHSVVTCIRLGLSWIFFSLNWFPEQMRMFYFNGYFICSRDDKR